MTTCLIDAPLEEASLVTFKDGPTGRILTLRLAESPSDRSRAEALVAQMYAKRGYPTEGLLPEGPRYATFLLSDSEGTDLGTVTVGSGEGSLRAEESYPEEIAALRSQEGRSICEFNALAILPGHGSAPALARLFHAALLAGGPILGHSHGMVEVTKTHARFYERILGFVRVEEGRECSRVGVVSVLLSLNFDEALRRAESCYERSARSRQKLHLYPFVFTRRESNKILERLSERLFSPARILRDRCIGSFPSLPEGQRSGSYRSGHRPSVPA